jgi:archaellum biogenesis ATPase FlaH
MVDKLVEEGVLETLMEEGKAKLDIETLFLAYMKGLPDELSKKLTEEKKLDVIKKEITDFVEKKKKIKEEPKLINYHSTLGDIMKKKIDPIEWLVEGWIPTKSQTLICGKAGSCKSYLTEYLALCLATGSSFINFKTKKCKNILILDMENDEIVWKERFSFLTNGYGIAQGKIKSKIHILHPDLINLSNENKYKELIENLKKFKIDTLIVDTLVRVAGVDENDAEEVSRFYLERMKPLLSNNTIENLILVHHLRKEINPNTELMDLVRGSGDWVNQAQVVLGLRKNARKNNRFHLYQLKLRRREAHEPIIIDLEADNPQSYTKFVVPEETEEVALSDECYKDLLAWFEEKSITTFSTSKNSDDMVSFRKKYSKRVVDWTIKHLREDKIIEKVKGAARGTYTVVRSSIKNFIDKGE